MTDVYRSNFNASYIAEGRSWFVGIYDDDAEGARRQLLEVHPAAESISIVEVPEAEMAPTWVEEAQAWEEPGDDDDD